MKRIISLALILAMLFCTSCKKENVSPAASPDYLQNEQIPDIKEPEIQEITTADKQDLVPNKEFDIDNFTTDNVFSEYEIVVALTDEETSKEKTYTPEDFLDLDIYYAYKYTGNNISYPEYKNKTILFLYLKQPSKQNVLNAVKKAKTDSRIYDACPSIERSLLTYNITVVIHDDNDKEYSLNDFINIDNIKNVKQQNFYDSKRYVDIETKDKSVQSTINTILEIKTTINNVEYVAPVYENYFANKIGVVLSKQESAKDKTYTAADFPYISGFDVIEVVSYIPENENSVVILSFEFSNSSLLYCADAVEKLNSDERITSANLIPLGKLTND